MHTRHGGALHMLAAQVANAGDLAVQHEATGLVGGRALVVNAIDEAAARFWQRRGFLPSRDDPLVLFRSIAAIAASLAEARQ